MTINAGERAANLVVTSLGRITDNSREPLPSSTRSAMTNSAARGSMRDFFVERLNEDDWTDFVESSEAYLESYSRGDPLVVA